MFDFYVLEINPINNIAIITLEIIYLAFTGSPTKLNKMLGLGIRQ